MSIPIRPIEPQDHTDVLRIAASLSLWFTPSGLQLLKQDLIDNQGFVSIQDGIVSGFCLYSLTKNTAQIKWMGLSPNLRRLGIGTNLLNHLKKYLHDIQTQHLSVSTLGEAINYPPYAETRAFYRKNGFKDFKIIQHPDNPEQEEELILTLQL